MFRKWRNKLLAGLAAVACSFGVLGVWAQNEFAMPAVGQAMAETAENGENENPSSVTQSEGAYSIDVVAKNLSYSDSLYILYAVSFEGFDESQNEVKMLFWNSLQTEYTVETAESVKRAEYTTTLGEQECIVFYSDGIAAKEMNDMVYCRAYAEVDGAAVYSGVEKYSVVDYVYEKREEGNLTANQTAVFADMLDYGASAQRLFDYNADKLANATYYTVTVENGTLEDGFAWGRYALNDTAILTANTPADGYIFSAWVDETNETVGATETLSITVTANKTYTAVYISLASAFEWTSDDESVTITKYIGEGTDVVIPSTIDALPVTSIGDDAFRGCTSLTSVVIPDSVTSIEYGAFYGCKSLTSVEIPNGVTSIGQCAFDECSSLTSVVIPESVTSIGQGAFFNCSSLTSVVIPDSVRSIGNYAFYGCSSLTSVVIPDSVRSIRASAFNRCSGLMSVEIGDGVTSIGASAFSECSSLASITVSENNTAYKDIDGNLYTKDGTTLIQYAVGKTAMEFIVPDSVTSIGNYAFQNCSSLTSVKISDNVTSVGDWTFDGCSSLTSVVIPDSVTSIGYYSFWYCSSLTSVVIPDSVTSIGKWAFAYCNSLTIYCEAESQPEGWSEDWNYSNCPVEWGYGAGTEGVVYTISSDGEYATVTGYTGTARKVEVAARYQGIPVTEIGYEAFHGCSSLTEIVLPDSITTISQRAFYACSGLKNFIIPNSVTTIVREAFSACSGLTEIGIPANVTYIEDAAFIYCHNLTKITVVSNNATYRDIDGNLYTKDGKRLMQYAMGKTETSFTVPNGVEIIASEAFNDSYNLTEVVLPDSVITISHSAFYNCYNLIDIVLPNSVKSIGPYAFKKCTSLTEIVIPISVTSISWCAFEGCNNLTIYCEATSKPSGWASNWNYSGRPVEWGYKE